MMKINGFNRKPHPYQIISYVFVLAVAAVYFFLIFPLSSNPCKIVGVVLESVAGLVMVISGFLATIIDPSDPILKECRKARFENKPFEASSQDSYCTVDHSFVTSKSKHCRRCNRCTEGFDHHCKWINNDIGKANYKHFFVLITSTMIYLTINIIFSIILTVDYANDSLLLNNDIFLYQNESKPILTVMIVIWVFMIPTSLFLILDVNLLLFHIFLSVKGLTTIQYVSLIEERKEYLKEIEEAMKELGGKDKKTCLDFVLCLKRKSLNDNTVVQDNPKSATQELARVDINKVLDTKDKQDQNNRSSLNITNEKHDPNGRNETNSALNIHNLSSNQNLMDSFEKTSAQGKQILENKIRPLVVNIEGDRSREMTRRSNREGISTNIGDGTSNELTLVNKSVEKIEPMITSNVFGEKISSKNRRNKSQTPGQANKDNSERTESQSSTKTLYASQPRALLYSVERERDEYASAPIHTKRAIANLIERKVSKQEDTDKFQSNGKEKTRELVTDVKGTDL